MSEPELQQTDIAIAHKDYAVAGGGEILAERLGLCFDAPVYAGYVDDRNRADLRADVRGLWNNGLKNKILRRGGLPRALLYQHLWESVPELHDYDIVVQSGNEPLWYVPPETQTTVAYTHSTPRLMYDLHVRDRSEDDGSRVGNLVGRLGEAVNTLLKKEQRTRYYHTTRYPDLFVANSELVARRIKKYWGIRDERVRTVHPPVPVDDYSPTLAAESGEDYYLSVNRLSKWKCIDTVVEAFRERDETLYVCGRGPEKEALEAQAADADNIRFLGYVSDERKKELLAGAKATVYNPLNEDFGIVPIESLASGTPVISVRDGYQRWQLDDGLTATMYERADSRDQTARNLRAAVERFEASGVELDADGLQHAVDHYRIARFNEEMREAVADAHRRAEVESVVPEPDPDRAGRRVVDTDGGQPDGD